LIGAAMPRSFLVCRRTSVGWCGGTGNSGKSRLQRQLLDGKCCESVEQTTELNVMAVESGWLPWRPPVAVVNGESRTTAVVERHLADSSLEKKLTSTPSSTASPVFRWNFDSDDETGSGSLPMALFGNGENVLLKLTCC